MRATLLSLIAALAFVASSEAFAPAVLGARLTLRSSSTRGVGGLCMQQDNDDGKQMPRRSGASIDADGKSNVWALEPKIVVVDPKSSDKANPLIVRPLSHPLNRPLPELPKPRCAHACTIPTA